MVIKDSSHNLLSQTPSFSFSLSSPTEKAGDFGECPKNGAAMARLRGNRPCPTTKMATPNETYNQGSNLNKA